MSGALIVPAVPLSGGLDTRPCKILDPPLYDATEVRPSVRQIGKNRRRDKMEKVLWDVGRDRVGLEV